MLELTARHFEEKAAVRRMRKFIQYFAANFRYRNTLYSRVQNSVRLTEIQAGLNSFFATPPERTSSFNKNYLQKKAFASPRFSLDPALLADNIPKSRRIIYSVTGGQIKHPQME